MNEEQTGRLANAPTYADVADYIEEHGHYRGGWTDGTDIGTNVKNPAACLLGAFRIVRGVSVFSHSEDLIELRWRYLLKKFLGVSDILDWSDRTSTDSLLERLREAQELHGKEFCEA